MVFSGVIIVTQQQPIKKKAIMYEKLSVILSAFVESLAMQAENMQRQACGSAMAYGDNDFFDRAKIIESQISPQKAIVKPETRGRLWNIPESKKGCEATVKGFFQHQYGDSAFPVVALQFDDGSLAWASLDEIKILSD